MVHGLFFCVTITGRRGGHTPFEQAGAETSITGAEAVKPDPGSRATRPVRQGCKRYVVPGRGMSWVSER